MQVEQIQQLAIDAIEDMKAVDLTVIDVRGRTSICDVMLVCSGTSTRHVKSIAENVVKCAKDAGVQPMGMEGEQDSEWVLVDLADILVHVMLPETRTFYDLEKLWGSDSAPKADTDRADSA